MASVRVDAAPRDRPGEQHLQRPALALAGDGVGREPEREDEAQPDGERVDEPERDRARQAEDVAAAELGELLGDERRCPCICSNCSPNAS